MLSATALLLSQVLCGAALAQDVGEGAGAAGQQELEGSQGEAEPSTDSQSNQAPEESGETDATSAAEGESARESKPSPDPSVGDVPSDAPPPLPESEVPGPGEQAGSQRRSLDEELAGADLTGTPEAPPAEPGPLADRTTEDGQRRDPPDYDGRPPEAASAGEVLIWVPRGLLFPAYLVMEYVVRRPIVWGVTQVEKWKIGERLEEAFTWDEGRGSLYPMLNFDFGIRPHIGLVANWKKFIPRHDVHLAGFVGPGDLWAGAFELNQYLFRDESATLTYLASYVRRPDAVYFGINDQPGPCQVARQGCRYRTAIAEGHATLEAYQEYLSGVEFDLMLRQARFSTEETDLPPISEEEAASLSRFNEGYLLLRPNLHFTLDTRAADVDFTRGTGVRAEAFGSVNLDLQNASSRWFRFGFEVAGFYDFGTGQIVGARLYGETIANVSNEEDAGGERPEVPFHELIQLGGSDRLPGFLRGRLRGNHAWTATLEYRYPIMWALDAGMFTSMGNVYEAFSDFDIKRNYLNYGFTLRVKGDRGSSFESIIGFGSSRMDAAAFDPFDQFRFTVGFNPGFRGR